MDSSKNKKSKPLSLEARHTKSIEASKEIRLKIQQSMFIPRERCYRYPPKDTKKMHSKKENIKNQKFKPPQNSEHVQSLKMQLKEKYTSDMCSKTAKNNKNFSSNISKSQNLKITIPSPAVAPHNSEKSPKPHPHTTISQNILSAEETAISNLGKLNNIAAQNSPDPTRCLTNQNAFKIESILNLREGVKVTPTAVDNNNKTSELLNFSNFFIDNIINKTSHMKKIPTGGNSQCKEATKCLEKPAAAPECPQIQHLSKAHCKSIDDKVSTRNLASKEALKSAAAEKQKDKHPFNSLFEADFQNVIRNSMSTAGACSPIDQMISKDLSTLDNCAKSFSTCIWQIHKDLDDKELETQNRIEYARKRDTEREKLLLSSGVNQPNTTEQIPKTFTIFIEAANLPKKSITFEASDILCPTPAANCKSLRKIRISTSKISRESKDTNNNPQTSNASPKCPVLPASSDLPKNFISVEASDMLSPKPAANSKSLREIRIGTAKASTETKYSIKDSQPNNASTKCPLLLPPSHNSPQNYPSNPRKTAPDKFKEQQKNKQIFEQVPTKVKPIKPIPLNVAIPNQPPPSIAANYLNTESNYSTQSQMYDNIYSTPNYYNYLPERNVYTNSWTAAREEWQKKHFTSPTSEGANWNLQRYQYPGSNQLPTSFMRNPYLYPIIDTNACQTLMTDCVPTYQDIGLGKY